MSGNGIVNNTNLPKNFILYSTYTGENNGVKITGNGDLYGAIYAPDTEIKVTGNGDVYGSLIGEEITITGNGDVYYDEALKNLNSEIVQNMTFSKFYAGASASYTFNIFLDGSLLYIDSFNSKEEGFISASVKYTFNDYNSFVFGVMSQEDETYYLKYQLWMNYKVS